MTSPRVVRVVWRSLPALFMAWIAAGAGTALAAGEVAPSASPEFRQGLQAVQAQLDRGDDAEALLTGRQLLRSTDGDAAVTSRERSTLYQQLLGAAEGAGDVRTGNSLATALEKHDRKAYGASSAERVPGLYAIADWHRWAGKWQRERDALTTAVSLLENAYGPKDARLAYPLRAIATACMNGREDQAVAAAALERARGLDYAATREDVMERSEVLAAQGDLAVVFGDPAAAPGWYRAAWLTLADSRLYGRQSADDRFATPRPLTVDIPDEPFSSVRSGAEHFAIGRVAFGFTVTPTGRVEDLEVRENLAPVESLPEPVTRAFRDARYRPRIQGGQPVATANHGYVLRFRDDPRLQPRTTQFGVLDGKY